MDEKKRKTAWMILFVILYFGFGAMAYRLYLRQAISYPGPMGNYRSDLPEHILAGRSGLSYSIIMSAYAFLMDTLGFNEKAVAIMLAIVTIGTTWLTYRVMIIVVPQGKRPLLHLLAFVNSFVMPIFLPVLNDNRYLGMQKATLWHNSTYLGMKFAAMLLLIFYFKYQETYQEKFSSTDFVWFTVLLIFVNAIKPNFILAFAPAMAVVLLGDCIVSRGKTLPRQILFGIPVLISLIVVIWQTKTLFDGRNSGSSIAFKWAYNLLRDRHPVAAVLQSGAFPYLVFFVNIKTFFKNRINRVSWLTWFFSMCQYLFLIETGPRMDHGNLTWGLNFGMFLIFVISSCQYYHNAADWFRGYRESEQRSVLVYIKNQNVYERLMVAYLVIAMILLIWHLVCGLQFTWICYQGGFYQM